MRKSQISRASHTISASGSKPRTVIGFYPNRGAVMSGTSADVREDAAIVICVTIVAVYATMEAAFGREYDGTGTKTKMITWRTRHLGVIITVVPIVSSAQGLNPVIRYGTMAASNPSSSSTSRSIVKFRHFQSFS